MTTHNYASLIVEAAQSDPEIAFPYSVVSRKGYLALKDSTGQVAFAIHTSSRELTVDTLGPAASANVIKALELGAQPTRHDGAKRRHVRAQGMAAKAVVEEVVALGRDRSAGLPTPKPSAKPGQPGAGTKAVAKAS